MKVEEVVKTHFDHAPCDAPIWALNGHIQTIAGYWAKHPSIGQYDSVAQIPTMDSEFLWGGVVKGNKPVVVTILHGLGGDVNSFFVQRSLRVAKFLNYNAIAINHRGAGEGIHLSRSIYHACRWDDLQSISKYVEDQFPNCLHIMLGVSLSGNMILKWLGTYPKALAPDLSIIFNAPIQFEKSTHQLRKGLNKIYDSHFVSLLKSSMKERKEMGLQLDHINASKVRNVHEFNSAWVAPLAGFNTVTDYYNESSSYQTLCNIKAPVLAITSKDDPFIDSKDYIKANWSSSCHIRIENNGGHGCYVQKNKNSFGDNFWLDEHIFKVLSQVI